MLDTRLAEAAKRGDTSEVLSLIDEIPPEWRLQELYLALLWAAIGNQVETIRALIERGAKVNSTYYRGHCILSAAAREGNKEAVELLLQAGADISAKDPWGKTALDYAPHYRHPDVARLLRENLSNQKAYRNREDEA